MPTGYENYSPQDFLNEAQTFNNPGAQRPLGSSVATQPEAPVSTQSEVATTIKWEGTQATEEAISEAVATPRGESAPVEGGAPRASAPVETGGPGFARQLAADIFNNNPTGIPALDNKILEAIGAGVPASQLSRTLKNNALKSRDATIRGALLKAGLSAQDAAQANQAGLITQAGVNNRTFTPRQGALGNIGEGLAAAGDAEALYQQDLANIEVGEAQRQANAEQLAYDREQDALDRQQREQAAAQRLAAKNEPNGWIRDLTEGQSKSLSLANETITGDARLTSLENSGKFDPQDIGASFRDALLTDKESGAIIGLNDDVLSRMDPARAAYIRSTMMFITGKLRKESGAAIGASEWRTEFTKVVPSSKAEFRAAQEYRQRGIKSLQNSTGAPDRNSFYTAAGFDSENYNADQWLSEITGNNLGGGASTPSGSPVDLDSLLGG